MPFHSILMSKCGLGQKCISVFELHQLIHAICLLEKHGKQQQPSVGSSVDASVGAAAGPLSGKCDMKSNEFQYKCIATILAAS